MSRQVVLHSSMAPQPSGSAGGRSRAQPDQQSRGHSVAVHRRVLRDQVYDAVLEMVLEGDLPQGQPIGIDSLASQLGVSQTPVREALAQLEHTGLIRRVALKGYYVAPPLAPTQMTELMDARQVVEVAAVQLAVPLTENVLSELRMAHSEHEAAGARASEQAGGRDDWAKLRQYFNADWAFHRVLLAHCGNAYLLEMADSLSPHLHRLRQGGRHGPGDIEQAVAEHAVILAAAEAGNADAAAAAMANHLTQVIARFQKKA